MRHYQGVKSDLMISLSDIQSSNASLKRADAHVLKRLQQADARAAESGLEVGGAGGEYTGLARVERAALEEARGGILGLTGCDDIPDRSTHRHLVPAEFALDPAFTCDPSLLRSAPHLGHSNSGTS